MKASKDRFSSASDAYRKFRPEYPPRLYASILAACPGRARALDAGTGNGQVARILAEHFNKVDAMDLSAAQIAEAPPLPNVAYHVGQVEASPFEDASFDLLTVAQAFHWFDFKAFGKEARRILKPEGRLAIWGYGLLRISAEIDARIDRFYSHAIGPYWDAERRHIDARYGDLGFEMEEIKLEGDFDIRVEWGLEQLLGYLRTWSGVKRYREANGTDPVEKLASALEKMWNGVEEKQVRIPVFLRFGKF